MPHLFVYGTLAPGEQNAHILNGLDGTWQRASVRGHRVKIGWGVHQGHPGLHPDPDGPIVKGLVFSSSDLPAHWERLDRFEGPDYERVLIQATLKTGDFLEVFTYRVVPRP